MGRKKRKKGLKYCKRKNGGREDVGKKKDIGGGWGRGGVGG